MSYVPWASAAVWVVVAAAGTAVQGRVAGPGYQPGIEAVAAEAEAALVAVALAGAVAAAGQARHSNCNQLAVAVAVAVDAVTNISTDH